MSATGRRPLAIGQVPLQGIHLIEASAGTGKTYTITSLLLRLLVERELPIERIAAVTFTNAATGELRERLERRLQAAFEALKAGEAPAEDEVLGSLVALPDRRRTLSLVGRALTSVDRASVFTIHGFAQKLLKDRAFESGAPLEVELVGDSSRLAYDAVVDFWSARVARLSAFEFRALGGFLLFQELERVAQEALAALDVPLVELGERPELEQFLGAVVGPFDRARELFEPSLPEVSALLASKAVNGNKMRKDTVARDKEEWLGYFRAGDPSAPLPAGKVRWTSTFVASAATKGNKPAHRLFDALEELTLAWQDIDRAACELKSHLRAELVHFVRERVKRELTETRTQSFDDLLFDLREALRDPERGARLASAIRQTFPVVLIDEFQDTDPVQYEIFRRIFQDPGASPEGTKPALYLIGDPKQSIYSFRGADVHAYLAAGSDAAGGVWTLSTSYRASPRLVKAQNALFSRCASPFLVSRIRYEHLEPGPRQADVLLDRSGDPLSALVLLEVGDRPQGDYWKITAREVARLLASGATLNGAPLSPRHVAVLTRTNRQAQDVQAELRKLGVPAVMHGDRSVFEAPEAKELRRLLLGLAEPGDRRAVRAALATRFVGLSSREVAELDTDTPRLETWTARLREWAELWRQRGIVHALERFASETRLPARTLLELDGERRLTNYRHLVEILHEVEVREHLGVSGLLRFLESAITDPLGHAMAEESRQLRLESDEDAVTLTTIHKSKGLEYDVVFLPTLGILDGRNQRPAFRFREESGARLELRATEERLASEELARREQWAEDLRLAYVGLTRPRHRAVVLVPRWSKERPSDSKTARFAPLAYLLHGASIQAEEDVASLSARLERANEESLRGERQGLTQETQGAIGVERFDTEGPPPRYQRSETERELRARPLPESVPEGTRTSSFSSLTRGTWERERLSRASREGRDVDEELFELEGVSTQDARETIALTDFPRGAGPGDALHALFELGPFEPEEGERRREIARREFARRGLTSEAAELGARAMESALLTPLTDAGLRLVDVDPRARRAELEFSLPVGDAEARLSARRLARALGYRDEDDPPSPPSTKEAPRAGSLPTRYLAEIARLPFPAWSGFLRGFIDLVFQHDGRLYLVDYKSNFLGERYEDYGPHALDEAMRVHHYYLQAYLYALALHRHGKQRIPNYRYEESFGGIFYLFVRGMDPKRGPSTGVYFLRPTEEEIESLSRLFEDPSGTRGASGGDRELASETPARALQRAPRATRGAAPGRPSKPRRSKKEGS